ncbi:MAG TPA: hypothetical protein VFV19_03040 [Candidatus Polarisedimenticolaceae bacterium]|nr:hypothetical protein [Candidatus Polarisedimenticolaceae bacterium]
MKLVTVRRKRTAPDDTEPMGARLIEVPIRTERDLMDLYQELHGSGEWDRLMAIHKRVEDFGAAVTAFKRTTNRRPGRRTTTLGDTPLEAKAAETEIRHLYRSVLVVLGWLDGAIARSAVEIADALDVGMFRRGASDAISERVRRILERVRIGRRPTASSLAVRIVSAFLVEQGVELSDDRVLDIARPERARRKRQPHAAIAIGVQPHAEKRRVTQT